MNVYETKQIYTITLYKIDVNYDIPLRNSIWRFFRKSYQMTSPYVCSFSAWHPYSNGEWNTCKITCDICLELLLHSLYGCQGLLNSQLSKKAKRDTTQMAKMTRIISHKWSRISKKKVLCLQGSYAFINNFWTSSLWQIVYYTFFFKLKQFLPVCVICPTESVF